MRNRHVFANMLKKNKKVNIFIKRHKKDCYLVLFVVNLYTGVRPRINPGDFFIVQILCKKCAKLCQIVQKYDTKRKNLRFWFTNINNKKTADSRGFYLGSPNQIRTGVLALKGRMHMCATLCFYCFFLLLLEPLCKFCVFSNKCPIALLRASDIKCAYFSVVCMDLCPKMSLTNRRS